MLDKKIIELLKPLRIKYFASKMIIHLSYALLGFSAISLILMLISRIFPITFLWNKLFVVSIVFLTTGILWAFIKRPSYYDTGVLADSMGLKERVVTALELSENNTSLANIQKQDTIEKLNSIELSKKLSLKPPIKILVISISLIMLSIMVGFIRTPSYDMAIQQQKNKELIEKEKENIEKVEKEIIKDKQLSTEEKKEIEKKLKELRKQLDKPKDLQNLQKDILKAKKQINELKKDLMDKKIKEIADKMKDKEFTKELAKKIESQDSKKIASQLQKMADSIKSSNQEELKKIANDMKALAKELSKNPQLAKAFQNVSEAVSQNISQNANNSDLNSSMNNLQQALSSALTDTEASSALTQATDALNQLSESVDEITLQSDTSNSNNDGSSSNGNSSGSNQGNSQGSNTGNGGSSANGSGTQGQGQGSGNGSSQGAGGGAGNGTSPGSESGTNTSAGSAGSKQGSENQVKEYEKLFTPKNIGGEGNTTQIHSNMNDSGNKDIIQIKKFGEAAGESVPYDEVLDSYKQGAYKRLNNDEIPDSMKEIIKEYFSELD